MIHGITGVRYARGCHPNDLWDSYFTSSKHVQIFREEHGEPDVIEVRQTFNDSLQAREWEHKVLRRLRVTQHDRWLNQTTGKAIILTEEMLIKIRLARKTQILTDNQLNALRTANLGKKFSIEHKQKISRSLRGRIFSEEHKKNISSSKKGYSLSEETKQKMSIARKRKETRTL